MIDKKSAHASFIDSVDECLNNGVKKGVFHLNTDIDFQLDGRKISVESMEMVNFGSCSYLGLEVDQRLKQGAIDATIKYGTQFSSSRAYISCGLYEEMETLVSKIFGYHAIVGATTTLVHMSAIPVLIDDNDMIILDHQVHGSIQNAVQLVKVRGVKVDLLRHSDLEALEQKILEYRDKHYRVWYMIDGVYSMFGDLAPIKELYKLLDKYPNFHLYVDDAHGMSWIGKNGCGHFLHKAAFLHNKTILTTSLAKGFGTGGGVIISTDKEIIRKIKTCGSSFVFSGPMQPPMLGASIASAQIHLSDEITELQAKLAGKMALADKIIKQNKLPQVYPSSSPIIYLALGLPRTGYNIVRKLMKEGFYVDIGIFPGVPIKRTGLRITITNNQKDEDIINLFNTIKKLYPIVLKEEGQSIEEIGKYFRMDFSDSLILNPTDEFVENDNKITIERYRSVKQIDKNIWDSHLGNNGNFDWEGCLFLEESFADNPEPENNWEFYYYIVRNNNGEVVACTFFTVLINKDDMLASENVSKQIELIREKNPYYLTSKVVMLGSMLTEGEHLYLDRTSPDWSDALKLILKEAKQLQETHDANAIYLRDFDTDDSVLRDFFVNHGFVRVSMPDSFVIEKPDWKNLDEFLSRLNMKARGNFRRDIVKTQNFYDILINDSNKSLNLDEHIRLYSNVKDKSFMLNTFKLPEKLFHNMIKHKNWVTIELYLKGEKKLVSVLYIYKGVKNITPHIIGIDYNYLKEHKVYKQTLYSSVMYGNSVNSERIYFGMGANMEKKKLGATAYKKSCYIQVNENFNLDMINIHQ